MTPTNPATRPRCQRAITAYSDENDVDSIFVDLLADAMHWCDAVGESTSQYALAAWPATLHRRIERPTN